LPRSLHNKLARRVTSDTGALISAMSALLRQPANTLFAFCPYSFAIVAGAGGRL
jgi:hypothetical protein